MSASSSATRPVGTGAGRFQAKPENRAENHGPNAELAHDTLTIARFLDSVERYSTMTYAIFLMTDCF